MFNEKHLALVACMLLLEPDPSPVQSFLYSAITETSDTYLCHVLATWEAGLEQATSSP